MYIFLCNSILILRNSQPSNQVNAKLLEAATKLESQIFTKATSLVRNIIIYMFFFFLILL